MSEIYIIRGGSSKTYHTDKDCQYITTATKNRERNCGFKQDKGPVRVVDESQAEHRGLDLCSACKQ